MTSKLLSVVVVILAVASVGSALGCKKKGIGANKDPAPCTFEDEVRVLFDFAMATAGPVEVKKCNKDLSMQVIDLKTTGFLYDWDNPVEARCCNELSFGTGPTAKTVLACSEKVKFGKNPVGPKVTADDAAISKFILAYGTKTQKEYGAQSKLANELVDANEKNHKKFDTAAPTAEPIAPTDVGSTINFKFCAGYGDPLSDWVSWGGVCPKTVFTNTDIVTLWKQMEAKSIRQAWLKAHQTAKFACVKSFSNNCADTGGGSPKHRYMFQMNLKVLDMDTLYAGTTFDQATFVLKRGEKQGNAHSWEWDTMHCVPAEALVAYAPWATPDEYTSYAPKMGTPTLWTGKQTGGKMDLQALLDNYKLPSDVMAKVTFP